MKIGIAVLAIILATVPIATAQNPPTDVVKISTSPVQLDATVPDSKGNVIRDLTLDDFGMMVFERPGASARYDVPDGRKRSGVHGLCYSRKNLPPGDYVLR